MLLEIKRLALPLILAALPGMAYSQSSPGDVSPWRLGAAIGYGERSNPLVQSDDIPIVVDLDIAWFGDRWFFDNGDAGLTFADNATLTASLVGRVNSDRVFFGRTDSRFVTVESAGLDFAGVQPIDIEPPERDYAVELGIEMLTDGRWGSLQLSGFHDASGTHDGYEIDAEYSFGWRRQRLYIEPSFGVAYKSARLNNYYWGLTAVEAGDIALPYEAGSGLNWRTRLMLGYQLTRHWGVSVAAEYERLNDEAAASPIVDEDSVLGWFAGMTWRF
jgi:outer membrane protein